MNQNEHPFHAVSADQLISRLDSSRDRGLSQDSIDKRLEQYGPNQLRESQRRSSWRILLDQFKSIMILLLTAAAIVALATARWAEGIALVAVTLINTLIGFVSEWKATRSMDALRQMGKHRAHVMRDGNQREVDAEALVPGDVAIIGPEQLVPADIRLFSAEQLRVSEAALTGESVPVHKTPDTMEADAPLAERANMLYKGTTVVEGKGAGIVVGTGMETELGRISEMAEEADSQATPLQQKLEALGRRLAWITLAVAAVVAAAGLIVGRDTVLMIETAIALGIAAVPEGLPIVATIALARGMWLMAHRNALVNRLTAVETLGATRVIFTDKTGTLTENKMTVSRVLTAGGDHQLDGSMEQGEHTNDSLLKKVIEIGVLCNNATVGDGRNGDSTGDPTEVALLEAGKPFNLSRERLLEKLPEKREVSFDPDVMMMATFHESDDGLLVAVKGSPEAVLDQCTHIADSDGQREMTDDDRRQWLRHGNDLAASGLRLLAVADKRADTLDDDPYNDLRFVGLVGMVDPPRDDIAESIEECQRAGIRVIMVTGDRPDTGQAIGQQVGLAHGGQAAHGNELGDWQQLSDEDRRELLKANVFARVTPEQKLNLIKLYQELGEIVAMTGDGVNDAPALKKADIGVAMGQRGTDAAKQMADMVLRDDQFSTIVAAVRQGRIIFANIRKSAIFMLCTNLAEILIVMLAALALAPIPIRPLQILFLNVLTDVFPALALSVGKGGHDVMTRPPREPDEALLTRHHWSVIAGWSVVIGACVLAALALALIWMGFDELRAITVSFLTLAFAKLWFVMNLRDRGSAIWNNDVVRNPWIWGSLVLCSGLLLSAVYWPPLSAVLQTKRPGLDGWLLILGMSLIPAILGIVAPGIRFYSSKKAEEEEQEEQGNQKGSGEEKRLFENRDRGRQSRHSAIQTTPGKF
jgi:P-type Ca2+ transporter type 2C